MQGFENANLRRIRSVNPAVSINTVGSEDIQGEIRLAGIKMQ